MAFATTADLEARLGRVLTVTETNRAAALLQDATAEIQAYTRQDFDFVANDTVTLRPIADYVRLPQRPVTAVNEVRPIDCDGQPGAPIGFCWDGSDKVTLGGGDFAWLDWGYVARSVQVTYSHGYVVLPDEIVATAANMANRVLTSPSMADGMVSERLGQYNYQLQQGTGTQGSGVRLTSADKDKLARYRRSATTVQVSAA